MTRSWILMTGLSVAIATATSAMAQQAGPYTPIPNPPPAPWNSTPGPWGSNTGAPAAPAPQAQSSLPPETGPAPPAQPVIDVQQVRTITRGFQNDLNRLGGVAQVTRCGPVLHLQPPQTGGYDESYGAICELQVADRHLQAVMCDNRRGNKFSLSFAAVRDLDAIGRFMTSNCFPEG
ncbi:MAG: hypothetical protein JO111_00270 [Caulobacteraceae bacterium]|nr:hypothetical protein [Caulobacteraceae bacterium]